MEIHIDILVDSYNSHPRAKLVLTQGGMNKKVFLKIDDQDREIGVDGKQLLKAVKACYEESADN